MVTDSLYKAATNSTNICSTKPLQSTSIMQPPLYKGQHDWPTGGCLRQVPLYEELHIHRAVAAGGDSLHTNDRGRAVTHSTHCHMLHYAAIHEQLRRTTKGVRLKEASYQDKQDRAIHLLIITDGINAWIAKGRQLKGTSAVIIIAGHLACSTCKPRVPAERVHTTSGVHLRREAMNTITK